MRLMCFGGPLDLKPLDVSDDMNHVVIPIASEYDPFSTDFDPMEITFRQVTYTRVRWVAIVPHPCVRGAVLVASWFCLQLRSPLTPEGEQMQGRIIMRDPPHSGWKPEEERPASSPEWWFYHVYYAGRTAVTT